MSKVQKYDPFGYDGLSALMHEDEHGEWVRVENYELAVIERNSALAECERLREALQQAQTSMLDSGYRRDAVVIRAIDAALSAKP